MSAPALAVRDKTRAAAAPSRAAGLQPGLQSQQGGTGAALRMQRKAGNQATAEALGGKDERSAAPAASSKRYTMRLWIGGWEWVRADQTPEQALESLKHVRRRLFAEVRDGIDSQQGLAKDREEQLITASVSSFFGRTSLPDVDIWDPGLAALDLASTELKASQIDASIARLREAAEKITNAKRRLTEYREGSIKGAERVEVGLEVIQTAAAVTISIGTGGLAGVALGAGYGAAQMTARQASEVSLGLRKKIDWSGITFDALFGVVTGMLGGALGGKLAKALLRNAAFRNLFKVLLKNNAVRSTARKLVVEVVSDFVSGRTASLLHTAARQVFDHVRGEREMTTEGFVDAIVATLTDPKQMFLDVLLGAAQRRGAKALTKRMASKRRSSRSPESGLELDRGRRKTQEAREPHEVDLGPTPQEKLELDTGPREFSNEAHDPNARDLGPTPKDSGLELDLEPREFSNEAHDPNARDLGPPPQDSGLELDLAPREFSNKAPNPGAIDLGRTPKMSLELDTGPRGPSAPARDPHAIDLGPTPTGPALKTYRGKKPANKIPGVKARKDTFGKASDEHSGTFNRKGMAFNELNAAEIVQGLRVDYDPVAGRPNSVEYRVDGRSGKVERLSDRSFKGDSSTEGAQAKNAAYKKSKFDRGHLAQREAFKGYWDAERAADLMTNIVPQRPGANRKGPWRAAEAQTMKWADQYGSVSVKVTPIYAAKPRRLKNGTPIPKAIHRKVTAPDGTVLDDTTYLNR